MPIKIAPTKYKIDDAHQAAKAKEGKFLSTDFRRSQDKYLWECKKKHQWMASFNNVNIAGTWCRKCAHANHPNRKGRSPKFTIDDVKEAARIKNGELISTQYRKVTDKLEWKCHEGHVWTATYSSIRTGTWCPSCCCQVSERLCRRILEYIYKVTFSKNRPLWLKSPLSNKNLELDCYNEELKIALEYQGCQHFEKRDFFKKEDVKVRQVLDKAKMDMCKNHGVHLLVVPYTVKHNDMYNYIKSRCVHLPDDVPDTISIRELEFVSESDERIKIIKDRLAKEAPNIELLTKSYSSSETPLQFRCVNGHEFEKSWQLTHTALSKKYISVCNKCAKFNSKKRARAMQELMELLDRYHLELTKEI